MSKTKNPIIIIPGLMGSIGGDMLPGTGEWRFGVAKWVYDPLIKGLQQIGYRLNENLFVCFYDWRLSTTESARLYLAPLINKVKELYPEKKLNLICHSMGGLVARNYLQQENSRGLVEDIYMLGTPNKGSIDAYYFWTTGNVMKKDKRTFYNMTYRGYVWLISKLLRLPLGTERLEELHQCFRGMQDLLPSQDYGYVLAYPDAMGELKMLPRSYMKYHNPMLDALNKNKAALAENADAVTCLVGIGTATNSLLILDREMLMKEGAETLVGSSTTLEGDGTVTRWSATLEGYHNVELKSTHQGLVKEFIAYYHQLFNVAAMESSDPRESYIHLIFTTGVDLSLKRGDEVVLSYISGRFQSKYEFIFEAFQQLTWLALRHMPLGSYEAEVYNISKQNLQLLLMTELLEEELLQAEDEVEKKQYYKISFDIK